MDEVQFLKDCIRKNDEAVDELDNQLLYCEDEAQRASIKMKISFYEQDTNSLLISLNGRE